ncbi:MAG TPA: cytochrome c-type biogenesis protein CcmH [Acidobacteriota bacterium]|nr:cytochrome c-type biogenesis protein CcmH [Acidobacteriota bacterium]
MRQSLLIPLILSVFVVSAYSASKPKMEDVASKLSCFCGTCPHLVVTRCGCSTADEIKVDIQKMIDSGMSERQIISSYVAKYGDTVLSAPPKKGFSLAAWAVPFLAFALGGVGLFAFLKQQQKAKIIESKEAPVQHISSQEEARYRDLLQKELDQRR